MPSAKTKPTAAHESYSASKKRRGNSPSPFEFDLGEDVLATTYLKPVKDDAPSKPQAAASVSEDISDLLGLLGDRLSKQFDSKKKQLESQAAKALQTTHSALTEHATTHQRLMESKVAEMKTRSEENATMYAKEIERLKKLQTNYQQAFLTIATKLDQLDKENRRLETTFFNEMQTLRKAEANEMEQIKKTVHAELTETQNRLKSFQEDDEESNTLKTSLKSLFH